MKTTIDLVQGDITKIHVDAVVNAADNSLSGGGGVDGAIHEAGGKAILDECMELRKKQGGCKTGEAVITTAGELPAKYVIHTVGPVWHGGNHGEEKLLRNAYKNSLTLAMENRIETIAFPNISTGVYHYPKELAAKIAIDEVNKFIKDNESKLQKIIFVCYDSVNYKLYQELLSFL